MSPVEPILVPVVLLSVLLGSVPTAWLVTRASTGADIRTLGSRNVGATNVYRCVGAGAGILVLAVDFLKGSAAILAAGMLGDGPWVVPAAGLGVVVGHAWMPWLPRGGGKGVATAAGVFLVLEPVLLGICLAVFLAAMGLTRKVAAGSVAAALAMAILCWFTDVGQPVRILAILLAVLIVWLHRSNLRRLLRGEEPPTGGPGEVGIDRSS